MAIKKLNVYKMIYIYDDDQNLIGGEWHNESMKEGYNIYSYVLYDGEAEDYFEIFSIEGYEDRVAELVAKEIFECNPGYKLKKD